MTNKINWTTLIIRSAYKTEMGESIYRPVFLATICDGVAHVPTYYDPDKTLAYSWTEYF